MADSANDRLAGVGFACVILFPIAAIAIGVVLARRGDQRGSTMIALAIAVILLVVLLLAIAAAA